MRPTAIALTMLLAGLTAGCPARMQLPKDFVRVSAAERGPYDMRGISADGVVMGLRRHRNPEGGTLEFWTEAVEGELTSGRGYRLTAMDRVESTAGVPGSLLQFAASARGAPASYLVAVFVTDRGVLVAEAGGKTGSVRKHMDAIRQSLLSAV